MSAPVAALLRGLSVLGAVLLVVTLCSRHGTLVPALVLVPLAGGAPLPAPGRKQA